MGTGDQLEVTDINVDRLGTLTITLTPGNPFDDPEPGTPPPGGLAGTVFTAKRIAGVNVGTPEGWAQAKAMTLAQARRATYDHEASATTDVKGVATFNDIPVGLYFVTAKVPSDGLHKYRKPQDMLLTIPVGQEDHWLYHVLINAKYEVPGTPVPTPTVPVVPPVVTTTVTQPPAPVEKPGVPGKPGEPGKGISRLPMTGATVLWAVGLSAVLLTLGVALLGMNRRRMYDRMNDEA